MVVVAASSEESTASADGADLAAVNAPHSVVVSGCEAAVLILPITLPAGAPRCIG